MQRWKLSALAAATLALSSLPATDAWALALGRITVQSALGEPLRAEVEIPQLSAAEADSLQAAIASPAAFRAQGMEFTGTANSVRVQVQKRANGSAVLKLSSFQPVNDPFVDLVIDANWASGKLQRNYTLLLDPPATRRPAPAPTTAAQATPAAAPAPARPAVTARPASSPVNTAGRDLRNDRDQDEAAAKPQRKRQAGIAAPAGSSDEVRVRTGDTAGRIAAAHKPAGVSLDQMLVAMLRSNPQAFVNGNINRMRSGAVIQLPDQAAAQATSAKEARQIMAAQSQDFNQFRRQLAGVAPVAPVEAASRSASGQVQAHVADAKATTAAPDKLTLSKGSVKGVAADEQVAQQKQAADQSARADELKRNMAELSQIAAATKPAGTAAAPTASAPAAAAPAASPTVTVPAASAANAAAPAPAPAADAAATSTPPATPEAAAADAGKPGDTLPAPAPAEGEPAQAAAEPAAPAPAPVAPPKPVAAPAPIPEEPSFIDSLMEDPTIPLAGAALLALLLGYGGYRVSQRRKAAAAGADSTLGDSQLSADSFFGASGGQRVDTTTSSSQMSGQSMQYSPSQLDAGDVDPLAEADVYLAYGRDLQAEEILKEALRSDPNRLVLHQKLAEIYAKRHDRMAYASVANNVFALTQGKGPEWQRLADQGRILDPENLTYQLGGAPQPQAGATAAPNAFSPTDPSTALQGGVAAAVGFGSALAAAQAAEAAASREGPPTEPAGMDFDMDLELPADLPDTAASAAPVASEPVSLPNEQDFAALAQWDTPAATSAEPAIAAADNGLNLDLDDLASFSLPATASQAPAPVTAPAPAEQSSLNALEFDLDSFTLPLQAQPEAESGQETAPLELSSSQERLDTEQDIEALTLQQPSEEAASPAAASAQADVTFDLSGLSLDLGTSDIAAPIDAVPAPSEPEDPLATKLALAEEFNAIGDSDGARTLIEEVIAEAHGDLKAKAHSLLSQIG
ncbi:membrane protein [Comamonas thiooxydans]|uniref:FimV/HubP family polar landmark protein n=1 Tax=Comamonas thiooxydans TaxID=363952 RepID=UPI000B34CD48|nr:FimV/HubP family polar landmark protein [Comamonas thiooxydans]BDR07683.1 membrane protein [Comamonas thiooxydans]